MCAARLLRKKDRCKTQRGFDCLFLTSCFSCKLPAVVVVQLPQTATKRAVLLIWQRLENVSAGRQDACVFAVSIWPVTRMWYCVCALRRLVRQNRMISVNDRRRLLRRELEMLPSGFKQDVSSRDKQLWEVLCVSLPIQQSEMSHYDYSTSPLQVIVMWCAVVVSLICAISKLFNLCILLSIFHCPVCINMHYSTVLLEASLHLRPTLMPE